MVNCISILNNRKKTIIHLLQLTKILQLGWNDGTLFRRTTTVDYTIIKNRKIMYIKKGTYSSRKGDTEVFQNYILVNL